MRHFPQTVVSLLAAVLLLASSAPAQSRAELKRELRSREAAAKGADAMMEVAKWAKENGLLSDYRRLLNKIIKKDPEHEAALTALGFVEFKGEWMEKAKAEALRQKELAASYEAKGMKKVGGVWVAPDEVEDAKKGIFHHDGRIVSAEEKKALMSGKVRHPRTGRLIAADDLPKAERGMFPLDDGRWVGEAEANRVHDDPNEPWILRTYYLTVVTTLPTDKHQEIRAIADGAVDTVKPLFGGEVPHPATRPVILICSTSDYFREVGEAVGGPGSAYGAFLAEGEVRGLPVQGRVSVCHWHESWGPYYLRHAIGIGVAEAFFERAGAALPEWFMRGVGSLAERHGTPGDAAFFGKQHLAKGGVKDVEDWLSSFTISGDLTPTQLDYNIYQSGLLLAFCMRGGDETTTEAMLDVTNALTESARAVERAVAKLERLLPRKEAEIREYFQKVIQQG